MGDVVALSVMLGVSLPEGTAGDGVSVADIVALPDKVADGVAVGMSVEESECDTEPLGVPVTLTPNVAVVEGVDALLCVPLVVAEDDGEGVSSPVPVTLCVGVSDCEGDVLGVPLPVGVSVIDGVPLPVGVRDGVPLGVPVTLTPSVAVVEGVAVSLVVKLGL